MKIDELSPLSGIIVARVSGSVAPVDRRPCLSAISPTVNHAFGSVFVVSSGGD